MQRVAGIAFVVVLLLGTSVHAASNVSPDHKFAWGETTGWTNWRDADTGSSGVSATASYLSGLIWCEQVGWINAGNGPPVDGVHYANTNGLDFGVNVAVTGGLSGLAWGEYIGWINFEAGASADPPQPARLNGCTHRFFGFVWAENAGWINLDDTVHFVAVGPCDAGDYDCDGDVDANDYAAFPEYFGGPDVPANCPAFDVDGDDDVDLRDFSAFMSTFNT